MVRGFVPQAFPGHVETNTDYPPQSNENTNPIPPTVGDELIEEVATVFDNLIYDEDGVGSTGDVKILGG